MSIPRSTISQLTSVWPLPESHRSVTLNIRSIDAQPFLVCLPPHPYVPAANMLAESHLQHGQASEIWTFLQEHQMSDVSIYWAYSNANVSGMGPAYEVFHEEDGKNALIPVFAARQFRVSAAFHLCFIPLDTHSGLLDIHDIDPDEVVSLGTLAMDGRPVPRKSSAGKVPRYINNKSINILDTSLKTKEERIQVKRVGDCFVSIRPLLTSTPYEVLERCGLVSPYAI